MADNFSQFKPSNFRVQLSSNLKTVELLANKITIPQIELSTIEIPHFTSPQPRPGDNITWESLKMDILLDESFNSIQDLYNTIITAKNPQTGDIKSPLQTYFITTVFLTTNKNNNNIIVKFYDSWVSKIDSIDLDSTTETDAPISVGIEIKYVYYEYESVLLTGTTIPSTAPSTI